MGIAAQVYSNVHWLGLVGQAVHKRILRIERFLEGIDFVLHVRDVITPFGVQSALQSPIVESEESGFWFFVIRIQRHHEQIDPQTGLFCRQSFQLKATTWTELV